MGDRRRPLVSAGALAAGVGVVALAVAGALLARHESAGQSQVLLRDQTEQAAQSAGSSFAALTSGLTSLAQLTQLTGGSPADFDRQTAGDAGTPLREVLAQRRGASFVVLAGSGFAVGEALPVAAFDTLEHVGGQVEPTPVVRHGDQTTVGLAIGYPAVPSGDVVYLQFTIDPFTAPATAAKPFELLEVALYGSRRPQAGTLVAATTRALPLSGTISSAPVTVGTGTWTLVAAPRKPLVGTLAAATPWIALGIGALAALLIGAVVEVLVRRRRYAEEVVAERTAALMESQNALIRSERLSAVGEMTTIIGHELRNPLAAVTNAQFLVREGIESGDAALALRNLDLAERETARAAALAEDLTAFMRERAPDPEPVDLDQVIEDVLVTTPPPAGVDVAKDARSLVIQADDRQMHQILTNLVTNAYQAMPSGGRVLVEAHREGDEACLTVEDDGIGFPDDQLDLVFEPFYTTKTDGTGLGLAIVRRLAEGHKGTVTIANAPRGGGRVTVRLPVHAEQSG
jgi:signal transduction histidine kinase